jgi:hypothetical protein
MNLLNTYYLKKGRREQYLKKKGEKIFMVNVVFLFAIPRFLLFFSNILNPISS